MNKKKTTSRRNFIQTSAVVAAGLPIAFSAKSYANIMGANEY